MLSIMHRLMEILDNGFVAAILGAIILALLQRLGRHALTLWAWWHWEMATLAYYCRRRLRRHKPLIACIDEYVYVLESLREALVNRFRLTSHQPDEALPEIIVCVYTRQLPSDWPLWGRSIDENTRAQTALEEYVRGFHRFLTNAPDLGYTPRVSRVIVIDNKNTEAAKARCKQLSLDLHNQKHFETYTKFLYGADGISGRVFLTERPWPGWLSDAVFYGVKETGKSLRWLWAVTTSYDAGEDLMLLRLHRDLNRRFDAHYRNGSLRLPEGVSSLRELAERTSNYPGASEIKDIPKNWSPP